eukprot:8121943-Prorocentrum_lima.AAC.1
MREAIIQGNWEVVSLHRSLSQSFQLAVDTPPEQTYNVKVRLRALADKYVHVHSAAAARTAKFQDLVKRGLVLT